MLARSFSVVVWSYWILVGTGTFYLVDRWWRITGWHLQWVCWPCKNWDIFCAGSCCDMKRWWWMTHAQHWASGSHHAISVLSNFHHYETPVSVVQNISHRHHGTLDSTTLRSANLSPTVCHLPSTDKSQIHLWRERLSKVPVASNVNICQLKSVTMMNCSQVETLMWITSMQMSLPEMFSEGFWQKLFVATIVLAAVRMAGHRWSWRWRCWMERPWTGVVTCGLQLDVLPNSLEHLRSRLMVDKRPFSSRSTALADSPSVMPIGCSYENFYHLWLCCVIKLHILVCLITMGSHLCNNHAVWRHLGMPHLWSGWIISAN